MEMNKDYTEFLHPAKCMLTEEDLHDTVWGKRIIAAEGSEHGFSETMKLRSRRWLTCACGTTEGVFMSRETGAPNNPDIEEWGHEFSKAVLQSDTTRAAKMLVCIQRQAIIELADMKAFEEA